MATSKKTCSDSSESKKPCMDSCDDECTYFTPDNVPSGITIIPGSGKLTEFPATGDGSIITCLQEGTNFLECIQSASFCPRTDTPTDICVRDCHDLAALANVNFINGNLIISDPVVLQEQQVSILQTLPLPPNELINIFPNLLGINGNLYIVGTHYHRITGFDRLRWVTGSIVIVNNPDLVEIPTFSGMISSGSMAQAVPPISGEELRLTLTPANSDPRCIRSAIVIANNASLRKVEGFTNLRQVKDGIIIASNPCLSQICGFRRIYRTDRVVIKSNARLSKIVGFCNLDTLNVGLYILDNNLDGLHDLHVSAFISLETAGNIVIIGNNGLKSIKLNSLRVVTGRFVVRSNPHLEDLESSVQFVGDLEIENNRRLRNIAFHCLQEVNLVNINANCELPTIDTFNELRRIGHGLVIADNRQLVELKGFNKVKYIGSGCVARSEIQLPNACNGCGCTTGLVYDWTSITATDCIVTDDFPIDFFDGAYTACSYELPDDFFRLVCNQKTPCGEIVPEQSIPDILSYSIIVYGNPRLRVIRAFEGLRQVESTIYVIGNASLHTIHAFTHLVYALDVWIRNNPVIKFIIGFSELMSVRDFIVYESGCLIDLNSIRGLEFAQRIAIEAKTARSVKYPDHPIPSVSGYTLYFSYDNKN